MIKLRIGLRRAFNFFMGSQSREKFIKYIIVGFSSFIIEYGLFVILFKVIEINELVANTLAISAAFLFNFLMNRLWSFKSREKIGKQFVLYSLLFVFNMMISNLFIWASGIYLGISPVISKVLIMGLIVTWNFVIYRKIIYRK